MLVFNDDTLLHAIGFNLMKLEGILKYGIVSYNYAKEHNIPYAKNYNFTLDKKTIEKNHLGDSINETLTNANYNNVYFVRMLYVSDDPLSAYNLYVKEGISLVVENMPFISDKSQEFIKRSDEVIVKDYVPAEKIIAITIPEKYYDIPFNEVEIMPKNILNYDYIVTNVKKYLQYLETYNHEVDILEISYLLKDLKVAAQGLKSVDKKSLDYQEALADYQEVIKDINEFLAMESYHCFTKILGESASIGKVVTYINQKYHNLEIMNIPSDYYKKRECL